MTSCAIFPPCVVVSDPSLSLSSLLEQRSIRRGASPKHLREDVIIIPEQNRLSYPHGRSTQIPSWSKQQASQDIVCWWCMLQIDSSGFLALCRYQPLRLARHCQCLCTPQLAARRHRFAHRDTPCFQKLRSSCTGRSALAVVIPIHRWRHRSPLMPL